MNGKHIITKKEKTQYIYMACVQRRYVIILLQRYGLRHETQLIVCIVENVVIFYFDGHYVYQK